MRHLFQRSGQRTRRLRRTPSPAWGNEAELTLIAPDEAADEGRRGGVLGGWEVNKKMASRLQEVNEMRPR